MHENRHFSDLYFSSCGYNAASIGKNITSFMVNSSLAVINYRTIFSAGAWSVFKECMVVAFFITFGFARTYLHV